MRSIYKISRVLSWINLIFWGLIVVIGLLSALAMGSFALIAIIFLFSSIVLHSYAALQLQKSIRNPDRPLNPQTAAGIRFVGFFALFFGVVEMSNGVTTLGNTQEALKMVQTSFPQFKGFSAATIRMTGILALLLGLSICVNVMLNFRLLRWYQASQQNNDRPGS